jgi:hypothetical protein
MLFQSMIWACAGGSHDVGLVATASSGRRDTRARGCMESRSVVVDEDETVAGKST